MRALMITAGLVAILLTLILASSATTGLPAAAVSTPTPPTGATPNVIPPPTASPLPLGNHPVYVLDVHNGGLLSDLHVIDADARQDVSIVPLRYTPEIIFSPDGAKMYVLDSYYTKATRGDWREVLSVFDAHTFQVLADEIPVPKRLLYKVFPESNEWFFPAVDGKYLFVVKYGDPDIHALRMSVLDATTLQTVVEYGYPLCEDDRLWALANGQLSCASGEGINYVDPLPGTHTQALSSASSSPVAQTLVSRDGNRLYRLTKDNRVSVVEVGVTPPRVLVLDAQLQTPTEHALGWARQLAMSPDGSRLYAGFVATSGELFGSGLTDVIGVYETQTWRQVREIRLSEPAWDIAVSNDGTRLYTLSPAAKSLSIFDTTTFNRPWIMHNLGDSPAQILVPPPTR